MDEPILRLRDYLDERFRTCDADGVYYAHQPIYGFRVGCCEPDLFDRYIRTDQILRALSTGRFATLLDVGSAEGYKAHLAERFHGIRATALDLSTEAGRRTKELFSIPAVAGDVHRLPFASGSFDVVLCSETLEHLPDWKPALEELLRVARQAVLITVPHEPDEQVQSIRARGVRFGHVSRFELRSLHHLERRGCRVVRWPLLARRLRLPQVLVEAAPRAHHSLTRYPRLLFDVYNAALPALRRTTGPRMAAWLVRLDSWICRLPVAHRALLFMVWKPGFGPAARARSVPAHELVEFALPLHRIDGVDRRWDWGYAPEAPSGRG